MASLLEQEIWSQPEVITRLLERETQHVQQIVAQLPAFEYALLAARGSSDHAATYAKYAWTTLGGYPVALAAPSLLTMYQSQIRLAGALVVGISQSGQSPDIIAVLEEGKRQGRPTLAITNDGASPLAAMADHVVELHAGPEQSIAATKTYTAQLAVMAIFAAALSGNAQHLAALQQLPSAIDSTLRLGYGIAQSVERYRYMDRCIIIGRGYNYATSFELALKLKELTYIMATAYSSADFRHGPIATIESGIPVFLIMPAGATFDDMLDLALELQQRGAELLVISEDGDIAENRGESIIEDGDENKSAGIRGNSGEDMRGEIGKGGDNGENKGGNQDKDGGKPRPYNKSERGVSLARTALPIAAGVPEWLSPLTTIIPGQLFALHLALAKGLNPDIPRGLQKVTKTL